MLCAESYPAGTVCPTHPSEVLLDPSQEAVLDLMEADDGQRQRRILGRGMTTGVVIALPFAVLAAMAFAALTIKFMGRFLPLRTAMMGFAVLGFGWSKGGDAAGKEYTPRFRPWLDKAGRQGHQ
jgi:hypothetical protein